MRLSTKRGFKARPLLEVVLPAEDVSWEWGPSALGHLVTASLSGLEFLFQVSWLTCPLRQSEATGVGQLRAHVDNDGVPFVGLT